MATDAYTELQTAATSPTASLGREGSEHARSGTEKDFAVTQLDESDPTRIPTLRKWIAMIVIGTASTCAAAASSIVRALALILDLSISDLTYSTRLQRKASGNRSTYQRKLPSLASHSLS